MYNLVLVQKLTGGMLLSRNKDFLVFYRGKDFLSPEVAEALLEKERLAKTLQDEEEQARLGASVSLTAGVATIDSSRTAGTLGETLDADARWGKRLDDKDKETVMREAEIVRHADLVRKLENKLAFVSSANQVTFIKSIFLLEIQEFSICNILEIQESSERQ